MICDINKMSTFDCPICYGTYQLTDPHTVTPCHHTLCYNCFIHHINSGNPFSHMCPMCRAEISIDRTQQQTNNAAAIVLSLLDLPINMTDQETSVTDTITYYSVSTNEQTTNWPTWNSQEASGVSDTTAEWFPGHLNTPTDANLFDPPQEFNITSDPPWVEEDDEDDEDEDDEDDESSESDNSIGQ